MTSAAVEIILNAQDRASKSIQTVEGHLLGLTKSARSLKRESYGITKFAGAIDTLAGTDFTSTILGIRTVAEVADPLARGLGSKLKSALSDLKVPLAKEGTTIGSAIGAASAAAIPLGITAGLGAAGTAALFTPQIIDHLMGTDASSQWAAAGAKMGPVWAAAAQKSLDDRSLWDKMFNNGQQAAIDAGDAAMKMAGQSAGESLTFAFFDTWQAKLKAAQGIWDASAQSITGDLASALQNNTNVIDAAMDKVTWAIEHPLELAAQKANLAGAIVTLQEARGMASNSGAANTIIDQQIAGLEAQWKSLFGAAYDAGVYTVRNFSRGLQSGPNLRFPHVAGSHQGGLNGGQASGGTVGAGRTYLVGERGPELLHMGKQAGSITKNESLGGGGDVYLDGEKVGKIMDRRMGRQLALAPLSSVSRG